MLVGDRVEAVMARMFWSAWIFEDLMGVVDDSSGNKNSI
jgi:hypothetical protein